MVVGGDDGIASLVDNGNLQSLIGAAKLISMPAGSVASEVVSAIGGREPELVLIAVCDQGQEAEDLCRDLRQGGWTVKMFKISEELVQIASRYAL